MPSTDTELTDRGNVTLGHKSLRRWNLPDGWVISNRPAHPALVNEDDFVTAQDINAARGIPQASGGGTAGPHDYSGRLTCRNGDLRPAWMELRARSGLQHPHRGAPSSAERSIIGRDGDSYRHAPSMRATPADMIDSLDPARSFHGGPNRLFCVQSRSERGDGTRSHQG